MQGVGAISVAPSSQASPTLGQQPAVTGGVAQVSVTHGASDWNLGLSPKVPMRLSIKQAAGNMDLNLVGLPINSLTTVQGVGALSIKAPARSFKASITQNSGGLDIYLPANTGLRITVTNLTGDVNFGSKSMASGIGVTGTYKTSNFASAKNKITMDVKMAMGSIDVHLPR